VSLLHTAQHLPAVDLRHHHVEKDQVGRFVFEGGETVLGAPCLTYRVALHLKVDADDLAHLRIVVHEQHERTARRLSRPRPFEEGFEIPSLVPAVTARRVERRHPAEIGPFPDCALRDAEKLRGLAEGQPVALARRSPPRAAWIP